ncbi:hypothetical protein QBC47DRAFT_373146 [Echria macrotheca]|uniref:EGF domain-specific O-linked N-acetylglucosamine transferase n=1 Tax=Echria macrotheca TaxID=438768 RepID=A0AAJ0BPU1_9PEZI|nr:hypothetical protein QBC47DRAFT_373146 [Echria macrotheca]
MVLLLTSILGPKTRRAIVLAVLPIFLVLVLLFQFASPRDFVERHIPDAPSWSLGFRPKEGNAHGPLPLPNDYDPEETESAFCLDRFSPKYLTNLRDTSVQYCSAPSSSDLTCFHSQVSGDEKRDSLCIGNGAVLESGRFALNCQIRQPDANETARGIIPFDRIRQYWYDTGPRYIFDHYVDIKTTTDSETVPVATGNHATQKRTDDSPRQFTLLLKREGEANPWHCLMEIWSMAMTFDVLRMARDDADQPFYRVPEDVPNTQVIILDNRSDGPYWHLWKLFSGREPIRLAEIQEHPDTERLLTGAEQRIIVPLAGAANPFWQNDWEVRDCTQSALLRVFARRVFRHYNITPPPKKETNPAALRVTFLDRSGASSRNLRGQQSLLESLKRKFEGIEVTAVDFAAIPFEEQLRIIQRTDVLVGVHGAGLTHTMFLRDGVTAVVEIQPRDMPSPYMGFRNMANMKGISYFRAHADPISVDPAGRDQVGTGAKKLKRGMDTGGAASLDAVEDDIYPLEKRASWHGEDFYMTEDSFVEVVGAAINSVYNKNMREHDAT